MKCDTIELFTGHDPVRRPDQKDLKKKKTRVEPGSGQELFESKPLTGRVGRFSNIAGSGGVTLNRSNT